MFDINSVLSILPISSQGKKAMSLLSMDIMSSISNASKEKSSKHQQSKKLTNNRQTKKDAPQSQKKSKKDAVQKTIDNKKDIYQQDCISDNISNKTTNSNQYVLSNITNEELKKYILFSDVLGTPVCKKRRRY